MSPRTLGDLTLRTAPLLGTGELLLDAVTRVAVSGLPALPVVDGAARFAGIFGEREFITALFPGYLGELRHAAFVTSALDAALEKRAACAAEPVSKHMNREHVEIGPDFSDATLAETFLHHRVLILPVIDADRRVDGVITRADFFRALVERFRQQAG